MKVEGDSLVVSRIDDSIKSKSLHGLYRNLLKNSLIGLSTGFGKTLLITGVGYKAEIKGKSLVLSLGYSTPSNTRSPRASPWRSRPTPRSR